MYCSTFPRGFALQAELKVIDNMHIAQRRNAVKQDRFSFRKVIKKSHKESHTFSSILPMEYEDMSIDEIFNGTPSFPGLLSFVKRYVEESNPDQETKSRLFEYIDFIRCKANGLNFCFCPCVV